MSTIHEPINAMASIQHVDPAEQDKVPKSRYRGVAWNKRNKRWQSTINDHGKFIYLGSYKVEEDAARAFDQAAIKLRGERANLNFKQDEGLQPSALADGIAEHRNESLLESSVELTDPSSGDPTGDPTQKLALQSDSQHLQRTGKRGSTPRQQSRVKRARVPGFQHSPEKQPQVLPNGDGSLTYGTNVFNAYAFANQNMKSDRGMSASGNQSAQFFTTNSCTEDDTHHMARAATVADTSPSLCIPSDWQVTKLIPSEDEALGILYNLGTSSKFHCAIWDGFTFHDMGIYDTAQDSQTATLSGLNLILKAKLGLIASVSYGIVTLPETPCSQFEARPEPSFYGHPIEDGFQTLGIQVEESGELQKVDTLEGHAADLRQDSTVCNAYDVRNTLHGGEVLKAEPCPFEEREDNDAAAALQGDKLQIECISSWVEEKLQAFLDPSIQSTLQQLT